MTRKASKPSEAPPEEAAAPAPPAAPPETPPDPAAEPAALAFPIVDRLQLADLMGVHPDTVTDFTRKGMPVVSAGGHGVRSEYDAVVCLAWWRRGQGKNAKENAQTRALEASAKINEMKLKVARGELVSRRDVIRANQAIVKGWATQVMLIPRRAIQTGIVTREMEGPLTALCRDICTEIHRWKSVKDAERAGKASESDI